MSVVNYSFDVQGPDMGYSRARPSYLQLRGCYFLGRQFNIPLFGSVNHTTSATEKARSGRNTRGSPINDPKLLCINAHGISDN